MVVVKAGLFEKAVDRFEEIAQLGVHEVVLGPPFSGDWREALIEIFAEVKSRRDTP